MKDIAQKMLLDLGTRYHLREQSVQIGNRVLRIWSTSGVDELLTDDTDPDEIPYWAEMWPSAIALSRTLDAIGSELKQKDVLELGCGLGVPSIIASLAGANVTATDYVEDALKFAGANAILNGADGIDFMKLDWRNCATPGVYDLVVGADVLYERKLQPYLEKILSNTLRPKGRAIIADPCRQAAVEFMARIESSGWRIEVNETKLPGTVHEVVMVYDLMREGSDQAAR